MRQDDALLLDMWIAARKIQDFTKNASFDDFKTNTMMQSAVLREIQVLVRLRGLFLKMHKPATVAFLGA
jgi:uncharacterized protein with HEPN domain